MALDLSLSSRDLSWSEVSLEPTTFSQLRVLPLESEVLGNVTARDLKTGDIKGQAVKTQAGLSLSRRTQQSGSGRLVGYPEPSFPWPCFFYVSS